MSNKNSNFIDFLYMLFRWRRTILHSFIITCIIAAGISLILPKWFSAKTTILPPAEERSDMGISSILNNLPVGGLSLGLGLGTFSEETNLFMAIINSRTMFEHVISRFNLMERYKTKNMEETRKALSKRIKLEINEDGTISLTTFAKTPIFCSKEEEIKTKELARDMANYIIQELDKTNKRLKAEKAHNYRVFIEKRYNQNLKDLYSVENKLKEFQEKYGLIEISEQTKAIISAAAELKAQITMKEIQLGVLKSYVEKTHPDLVKTRMELHELRKKYNELKYGSKRSIKGKALLADSTDIFIPINRVPDLGLQYARLFRDVKLQQTLLEFLLPQYEQAKLQEAKDTPTLQVLDTAITPELKTKPKRAIIVAIAGLFSIFISVILISLYEQTKTLQETDREKYRKIQSMAVGIKNDLIFWRKKK